MSPRRVHHQSQGFVLLMSMLILAAVVAIAAGLTRIVYSGIYTSRGLNDAIVAYFASETGIERSLYWANYTRIRNGSLSAALALSNTFLNVGLTNNAAYTVTAARSEKALLGLATEKVQFSLDADQAHTIDLFDPDDLTAIAGNPNYEALSLSFLDGDTTNTAAPWLEVSLVELTPGISLDPSTAASSFIEENPGGAGRVFSPGCTEALPCYINALRPDRAYRVRVKALYDAANATVIPCRNDNCAGGVTTDLKSLFAIKSVGSYPAANSTPARQAIQVTQSWLVPSSPLFDYTVFSEQTLQKR